MIRGLENLSKDDKLFMICNPNLFSLPTRSTISFKTSEWLKDGDKNNFETIYDNERNLKKSYSNLIMDLKSANYKDIESFIRRMIDEPFETKEDICDFLIYVNFVFEKIESEGTKKEDLKNISDYIFSTLIPYKLQAYEIHKKMMSDVIPADKNLYAYTMNSLRLLFDLFVKSYTINVISFVVYMIVNELELENRVTNPLGVFIKAKSYMNDYSINTICDLTEICNKLNKGGTDAISLLDEIDTEEEDCDFVDFIKKRAEVKIKESFKKDTICTDADKMLAIGNNVLPRLDPANLIVEIEQLQPDYIKSYIGDDTSITYEIPERMIGYLEVRENVPICKVMYDGGKFYTLIRYHGESYLLFLKEGNNSVCFGLSFPANSDGERYLVSFSIPDELDYKLEI